MLPHRDGVNSRRGRAVFSTLGIVALAATVLQPLSSAAAPIASEAAMVANGQDANTSNTIQYPAAQRKEIQRILKARGFYPGAIDGIVGPETEAGLREFQRSARLVVTGQLNPQTVAAIIGTARQQSAANSSPTASSIEQEAASARSGGNQTAANSAASGPAAVGGIQQAPTANALTAAHHSQSAESSSSKGSRQPQSGSQMYTQTQQNSRPGANQSTGNGSDLSAPMSRTGLSPQSSGQQNATNIPNARQPLNRARPSNTESEHFGVAAYGQQNMDMHEGAPVVSSRSLYPGSAANGLAGSGPERHATTTRIVTVPVITPVEQMPQASAGRLAQHSGLGAGLWGLFGLLGLVGAAGLSRRHK